MKESILKANKFKGANITFAENQPEYLQLPAFCDFRDEAGQVVTCYRLSFLQWLSLPFRNFKIYFSCCTYRKPLHPQRVTLGNPVKTIINELNKNENGK